MATSGRGTCVHYYLHTTDLRNGGLEESAWRVSFNLQQQLVYEVHVYTSDPEEQNTGLKEGVGYHPLGKRTNYLFAPRRPQVKALGQEDRLRVEELLLQNEMSAVMARSPGRR